ncbi:MAG: anaerobic ribonucleoside-triphosphate reductase activating protein [Clostridia bacterium]|nr:anaerobic ribonucleoside-triphosphate reductase activating protein [Clostridia bacterium]
MKIGGLQRLTLLDFPGTVSCTIFTIGCNFKCPFCHNALLALKEREEELLGMTEEEVFEFLEGRKKRLDGVCITGGEPLLQSDIRAFIQKVRALGYKVKLDTNGSNPELLEALIDEGLLDYVAMDIKNSKERYKESIGVDGELGDKLLNNVIRSVEVLKKGKVDYEFRTTVVDELHETEDIASLCKWIEGAPHYYIQDFNDSGDLIDSNMHQMPYEKLKSLLDEARKTIPQTGLRGTDEK